MKFKNILLIVSVAFSIFACTAEFDNINTDPNRVTEATNGSILVAVQRSAANHFLNGGGNDEKDAFLNSWAQYTTNSDADSKPFDAFVSEDGNYNTLYHDILYQLEQIKLTNTGDNLNRHYYAISEILQCWAMANAVEMYGAMPYFDALHGATGKTDLKYTEPKFDSEEEIYKDVIARLDTVNFYLVESAALSGIESPGKYDIYAGGNMVLWRKFANALQAKLYLRISSADNMYGMAGLEKLFAAPTDYPMFTSYKEFMGLIWLGLDAEEKSRNSMAYTLYKNGTYTGVTPTPSTAIVRMFAQTKDPRRFVFLTRPKSVYKTVFDKQYYKANGEKVKIGDYIYPSVDSTNIMSGFPPAQHEDTERGHLVTNDQYYSTLGGGFANVYRADLILDYAELCFIKAEAKLKGVSALNASVETYYEAGINASLDYYKDVYKEAMVDKMLFEYTTYGLKADTIFAEAPVNEFLNDSDVKLTGDLDSDFEKIITQRFIASFNNGYNAFSLIRRTGYPKLDFYNIGIQGKLGYPTRWKYPDVISQTNGDNLIKIIGKLQNTIWDEEVWFFQDNVNKDPQIHVDSGEVAAPIMDYIIYDVFTCEQIYPSVN